MKKKLLGILFMACLIFIFTPKSVMAYSYYCDVTGFVSGTDLDDTSHSYYFADKGTGYMYYIPDMSNFQDGSNITEGVRFDNLKMTSYGNVDKGTIVLHTYKEEKDGTKFTSNGLKFEKKGSNYYIYLEYLNEKYYLNIDRDNITLVFSTKSKTEWKVNKKDKYTFSIIDNKTKKYYLRVQQARMYLAKNEHILYAFEVNGFSDIKYSVQDGQSKYTHAQNLPDYKDKQRTFCGYTKKPFSEFMKTVGFDRRNFYIDSVPKEGGYEIYNPGDDPKFDSYEKSAEKTIYANYYSTASIKLNWNINPTDKDVVNFRRNDYNGEVHLSTDTTFTTSAGGWIEMEFPSVYQSGKYYKVTSVKANGVPLSIQTIEPETIKNEDTEIIYPEAYLFRAIDSNATYEITIEASYPEVKDFHYYLYTPKYFLGDYYTSEKTIKNLSDNKVKLYATSLLVNSDGTLMPEIKPIDVKDYEQNHSFSYSYEYYKVEDGKETKLDLTGNNVYADLSDIFKTIEDKKEIRFYAMVTKTRNDDGATKTKKTNEVVITCQYEGGDFDIDLQVDTVNEMLNNVMVIRMKKDNETNEIAKCEVIKEEGDTQDVQLNTDKIGKYGLYTVRKNGTYTVRLTDKFGKLKTKEVVYHNIVNDVTPPEISGVEDNKTYCLEQTITVTDEHLMYVMVNNNLIKLDDNHQYKLSGTGKQEIMAVDTCSNITTITVTINGHHTGGVATCTKKAVCDICESEYGEVDANNHTGDKKWITTGTTHEQRYTCCNAVAVKKETHSWKAGKCTKCGVKISVGKASITTKSADGTTTISWKKVTNASGYKVYRATSKTGKYTLLKTTSALSYLDKSIVGGKNYYYKVVAYYKDGKTTINAKASNIKLQVGTLKKVSLTVKNKNKKTASLSWKKIDGAKGYQIYSATSKNGKYKKITTTKKLTFEKKSLTKNKTYYYKVRSYYVKNGKNIYSSYSDIKSIKIKK